MSDGGPYPEDIAMRLVALRTALGYSQAGFAKHLDLTAPQLNNYEQGIRTPSLAVARQIRLRTGATLDWIYNGDRGGLPLELLSRIPDLSSAKKRA